MSKLTHNFNKNLLDHIKYQTLATIMTHVRRFKLDVVRATIPPIRLSPQGWWFRRFLASLPTARTRQIHAFRSKRFEQFVTSSIKSFRCLCLDNWYSCSWRFRPKENWAGSIEHNLASLRFSFRLFILPPFTATPVYPNTSPRILVSGYSY